MAYNNYKANTHLCYFRIPKTSDTELSKLMGYSKDITRHEFESLEFSAPHREYTQTNHSAAHSRDSITAGEMSATPSLAPRKKYDATSEANTAQQEEPCHSLEQTVTSAMIAN